MSPPGTPRSPSWPRTGDSLAGKILRIRPDGRAAPGNPFGNRTWSYGHRNVEGLALDARNRLWATEFGEQDTDELNLITRGKNYGWPEVEGTVPRLPLRLPEGLLVADRHLLPGRPGHHPEHRLRRRPARPVPVRRAAVRDDGGEPKAYFAEDHGRIRSVAVAPDGALWVTTSNTDGRVDPGRDDDKILRVTL